MSRRQEWRPGGSHAGHGDVASGEQQNDEDGDEDKHTHRHESDQHTGRGGNALATLEANPRGVVVAQNREEGGEDVQDLNAGGLRLHAQRNPSVGYGKRELRRAAFDLQEVDHQQHGNEALENVEEETRDAELLAECAPDVGGADIT